MYAVRMETTDTIVNGHNFGTSLHPYERKWVALDKDTDAVIESDADLEALIAKLSEELLAARPRFMQVLPHDVSFAGTAEA